MQARVELAVAQQFRVLDRGAQELRADEQLLVASYLGERRAADATS